jgi:hypothetical protein
MKWYHYVACFFAGVCLANTVPHFVMGVTSVPFPTPFSNHYGVSSPPLGTYISIAW